MPDGTTLSNDLSVLAAAALVRLTLAGGAIRRFRLLALPDDLLSALAERICDRRMTTEATFQWLSAMCREHALRKVGRSVLYRFSAALRREASVIHFEMRTGTHVGPAERNPALEVIREE